MRLAIAGVLAALTAPSVMAQTSYFRCTDDSGKPVFSQRPCGEDAKKETVTPLPPASKPPEEASGSSSASSTEQPSQSSSSDTWDKIKASNRLRDVTRQIERVESRIESIERERDRKIAALDNKRKYALNNLAGATYLESLANEKQGVVSQYESRLSAAYRDLDSLEREARELRDEFNL